MAKMKAWNVELMVSSERLNPDSLYEVELPWGTVIAPLVKIGVEYDFYFLTTVFFDASMSKAEVKRSLIEHDGYPPNIGLISTQGSARID